MAASLLNPVELDHLVGASHWDPFSVLGPHVEAVDGSDGLVIRCLQPYAARVEVVQQDDAGEAISVWPMERVHGGGVFEAAFKGRRYAFRYRLRVHAPDGTGRDIEDAYRFGRVMGDVDLHLLGEGKHQRLWERLGAHLMTIDGVAGTYFAVWAPNAARVSVVGDWNGWDGRAHQMRRLVPNGIWEMFIPGVGKGSPYKYEIRGPSGGPVFLKCDPCARFAEVPPQTASVVWDASGYAVAGPGVDRGPGASGLAGSTSRWRPTRCTSGRGGTTRTGVRCPTGSLPRT